MTGSAPKLEHMHVITADHEINEDATMEVYREQPNLPGNLHQQIVLRGTCIMRRDGTFSTTSVDETMRFVRIAVNSIFQHSPVLTSWSVSTMKRKR
ncbi:hypothetical protein B9Z55_007547 [Caenorhabditis nigoni]|uniref:Uncharacterized protein n=1 Tax=Caenorhabditis nigoni TaxID=1611254 RepID=A0A2G5VA34_9PELO|nr:hypothetical protein B9Z55_007547 [Caenorhabditis nigoni]